MSKPQLRFRHYLELPEPEQALHTSFLHAALEQALIAGSNNEVPIGCVIVNSSNEIIGTGQNQTIRKNDVLAHAEVEALKSAAVSIGDFRLDDCRCYVTIEPCLMCLGALLHARITTVHFGSNEPKFGAINSRFKMLEHERFAKFECVY